MVKKTSLKNKSPMKSPPRQPVTKNISDDVSQASLDELIQKVQSLEARVSTLNVKVNHLEKTVVDLSTENTLLRSLNAVSTQRSATLRKQIEISQQYSRRNCIIFENIKLKDGETINSLENV